MALVSTERYKALENLAQFMRGSESTVTNALRVYARNMNEAAEEARKAYEAGVGKDPVEPAPGKVSVAVTNGGYKMLAEQFEQNAQAATKAADQLEEHLELLLDVE